MENAQAHAERHGVHSVTPHLVCDGAADAIEFYKNAFNAEEMIRLPGPDGKIMHACMRLNGSSIMLMDASPECGGFSPKTLKGTPVSIHLVVDDVDKAVDQAVTAGASVVMPVQDMFWGDRFGVIEDPFGHQWSLATQQREMSEEELREAARNAVQCGPQ